MKDEGIPNASWELRDPVFLEPDIYQGLTVRHLSLWPLNQLQYMRSKIKRKEMDF